MQAATRDSDGESVDTRTTPGEVVAERLVALAIQNEDMVESARPPCSEDEGDPVLDGILRKSKQAKQFEIDAFWEAEHPSFRQGLIDALDHQGYAAESLVEAWEGEMRRATVVTDADCEREKELARGREAFYRSCFETQGCEFAGMARPNGSERDPVGVGLCWPPWHPDPCVLTRARHTPRMLSQAGASCFVFDALEIKQTDIEHVSNKLPKSSRDIGKMTRTFPGCQQPGPKQRAMESAFRASLERNSEVVRARARFASITLLQGQFQRHALETALTEFEPPHGLQGVQMLRFPVRLAAPPSLSRVVDPVAATAVIDVLAFVRSDRIIPRLLGVFLLTVHGSQGKYARGQGGPFVLCDAYALDLALDFTLSYQSSPAIPGRFPHTICAWPGRSMNATNCIISMRYMRAMEQTGRISIVEPDMLPRDCLAHIERMGWPSRLAPDDSGGHETFLALICSISAKEDKRNEAPERKEKRIARMIDSTKNRSEQEKQATAALRLKNLPETRQKLRAAARKKTKAERSAAAVAQWAAIVPGGITKREKANASRRLNPLLGGDATLRDEPPVAVAALLLYQGGFFDWAIDTSRVFTSVDVTVDNLRLDGRPGQIFTRETWAKVQKIYSGQHAVEPWVCANEHLVFPRPTRREYSSPHTQDQPRMSGQNSHVFISSGQVRCKLCDGYIGTMKGIPPCRPLTGWRDYQITGGAGRLGAADDLIIRDLDSRMAAAAPDDDIVKPSGASRGTRAQAFEEVPRALRTKVEDRRRGAPDHPQYAALIPYSGGSVGVPRKRKHEVDQPNE